MNLSTLPKIVKRAPKRIGRGHGSGKVKTAGRGTKGQKARGTMPSGFEGGQLALTKRLPLLRGKGRNRSQKAASFPLSLSSLSVIPAGTKVTLDVLRKYHMIEKDTKRVKILHNGSLTHALTIALPCSKHAREAIEKAGGSVVS